MARKHREAHGRGFTVLVCNHPYGSYPDHNLPIYQNPPPMRRAFTYQHISTNGSGTIHPKHVNGLVQGGFAPKTATLTVDDNDFSTGACVLTLGDYTVTAGVDYEVGADVATTAANLAAAINMLPGFSASALVAVVTILCGRAPMDEVDFYVEHHGTIINMTPLVPADGVMDNGSPTIGPPAQS